MKTIFYIALLILPLGSLSQTEKLYTEQGNTMYHDEAYVAADSLYAQALEVNENYLQAKYNRALSQYQLKNWEESIALWDELLENPVDSIKANSLYNRGNTKLKYWMQLEGKAELLAGSIDEKNVNSVVDIEEKMTVFIERDSLIKERSRVLKLKDETLDAAIEDYKNCLRTNGGDDDARYNLIYARGLLPKLEDESPQQKKNDRQEQEKKEINEEVEKAFQEALRLIEKSEFEKAYNTLKSVAESYPEETSKLQKLMGKLEVINDILIKE